MKKESHITTTRIESLDSILEQLFSLHRFGIQPGLSRIQKLLYHNGNPENKFKSIHVTGTNGKGSVSSVIASILMEQGYKVGLYTSPHLLRFNERIRINGIEISDEELMHLAQKYMPGSTGFECTFFEITTAMAFQYFADNKVDFAVLEAGMGGRDDATNVITPVLSVITNVDLDHTEYLGNSIEEIADNKAGIFKKGVPALVAYDKKVRGIFLDTAFKTECPLYFTRDLVDITNVNNTHPDKMNFSAIFPDLEVMDCSVGLTGEHQANNIQTALSAIYLLKREIEISRNSIISGLANLKQNSGLRGRIELIKEDPTIIFDTAHNAAGINALVNYVLKSDKKVIKFNILFAAMSDKNTEEMLNKLSMIADKIILTKPKIERATNLSSLAETASKYLRTEKIKLFEESLQALEYCLELNEPLIITGSFYLAGELYNVINEL